MSTKQTIDLRKVLEQRRYDRFYKPPPEDIILTIEGENVGSKGNFVAISGLPKSGKTTFLASIIASSFLFYPLFDIKMKFSGNIGYFDTESSQNDFYKNIERIRTFAGYIDLPDTFHAYNTRVDPFELQKSLLETYINQHKPDVLIIDGLLDLVKNFNDESESRQLMDWLKAVTQINNMLIIGCIHLGKKDNHTLGHFGSMVDRYSQSIIEIVRDHENDLFLMKPKMLRSARWFNTIALQKIGNEYMRVPAPIEKKSKR